MSGEMVLGYIGALLAGVFFGSNYVPVKKYSTGDGFSFVWVFSSGVMAVGFVSVFINGGATFVFSGILGGSLWATGNLCVIPIVSLIGLGLGLLLWGSSSLVTGFILGKFGLLGLHKDVISNDGMNWGGIVCIVAAMGIFFFIKPTLDTPEEEKGLLNRSAHSIQGVEDANGREREKEKEKEIATETTPNFWETLPQPLKLPIGVGLAVFSGILYGVNMVPMSLWTQDMKDNHNYKPKPLEFVLCHFTGIYLFNTVVFLAYCIYRRRPVVFPETILPSFISGAMWGIAQCGLMIATSTLGYTIGFPIGSTGPLIVSSLWSVLYFREIRGVKNISLLGGSFALLFTGIVLLAKSQS